MDNRLTLPALQGSVAAACGRCAACGQVGRAVPSQRRNVRGERPYWRLAGFLGSDNVAPFLKRYLTEKLMTEK